MLGTAVKSALIALLVVAGGCSAPAIPAARHCPPLVERARVAMGSELRLTAATADQAPALAAFEAVFLEIDRLESLMSIWREGSDVERLNASAGVQPIPVSPEVREVLQIARQVSEETRGAFDVTFGPLAGLWKFDHDQDDVVPGRDAVRQRLPLVNYEDLVIDSAAGTAFLRRKGMRVHLGGVGKGYAVDRAAAMLRTRGLRDFLIQAGGDLYASGTRGGRPWRLGIRDPRGPADRSFATIELSGGTLSTSGDYERFFMKDGRRYHHILDLRTGEPARLSRSVTIVTPHAVLADALAKAVFILGPDEGLALIERLPAVEGVIVSAANDVVVSSGLKDRLALVAAPTDAP